MGGGAAMRAAAKAAGVGIMNGGLRGVVPDHPVSAAARKAARPFGVFSQKSSSSSTTNAVKTVNSVGNDHEPVQMSSWELDEWEFAGGEDDFVGVGVASEGMPRLVFGGAPSIEEAKEATSELKDVLEKAYLSSSPGSATTPRSRFSQSEDLDIKSCVAGEMVVAPVAPKHAMQAFRFLNESPAVQSIVASIASDPNVWNAVLHNPALQEYIQSQKNSASSDDQSEKELTSSDTSSPRSPIGYDGTYRFVEPGEPTPPVSLMEYFQNLKHSVVDMMSNLGDYFQNLFNGINGEKDEKGNAMSGFLDKALGPSLMGLAVMVIMLVVLKRA